MMDMISGDAVNGGAESGETEAESIQFFCKGMAASPFLNDEVDIEVAKDGFALSSVTGATRVPWADVKALRFEDYTVHVQTVSGPYTFSKLGREGEPLYAHMLSAYGDKVRKCLFVKGRPKIKAKGDVNTNGRATAGVPVEVYEDCILSLPPNLSARRVPLYFANGLRDEDYTLTVSVIDGTETVYSKLGYDHAPAADAVRGALKKLRAKQLKQLTGLDGSLTDAQASELAKLMPGGLTAPMGAIRGTAPSFADALGAKIAKSRAAETYKVFQEISGADSVCVGFRVNDLSFGSGGGDSGGGDSIGSSSGDGDGCGGGSIGSSDSGGGGDLNAEAPTAPQAPDPYMFLIVAPSPAGDACALEFAGEADQAAATFVYRFSGAWDDFRVKLGMALEAIAWKREVIRYTDEELSKPENKDFYMTNERNEALRFVRSCFVGRAIHRSMDSWKTQLMELLATKN